MNFSKVENRIERIPFSGCWIWLGPIAGNGHGVTRNEKGRVTGAHRLFFERTNGKLSAAVNVLHKCDVKTCVNPEHLYAGTQVENVKDTVRRGQHFWAKQTTCLKGHPLSGDNLYLRPDGRGRECKACGLERIRKYLEKKRGPAS